MKDRFFFLIQVITDVSSASLTVGLMVYALLLNNSHHASIDPYWLLWIYGAGLLAGGDRLPQAWGQAKIHRVSRNRSLGDRRARRPGQGKPVA